MFLVDIFHKYFRDNKNVVHCIKKILLPFENAILEAIVIALNIFDEALGKNLNKRRNTLVLTSYLFK